MAWALKHALRDVGVWCWVPRTGRDGGDEAEEEGGRGRDGEDEDEDEEEDGVDKDSGWDGEEEFDAEIKGKMYMQASPETGNGKRAGRGEEVVEGGAVKDSEQFDNLVQANDVWVLRHGVPRGEGGGYGWIGGYTEGDGELTNLERKRLKRGCWDVPIVLQRHGVSFSRREKVVKELENIVAVLREWFDKSRPGGDGGRKVGITRIVCGEACRLRIRVGVEGGGGGGWDLNGCQRMLLVLTGFERELIGVEGMSSVLQFVWLSRVLEWVAVREVADERRRLYRGLGERDTGEEEKRKWVQGWVQKWNEEKEDWIKDLQSLRVEDVIEKPDLWRFVDDRVQQGEDRVVELLRAMEVLYATGRRMAVDFPMTIGSSEMHEEDFDFEHGGDGISHPSSPRNNDAASNSSLSQSSAVPFHGVDSVIFQCHRSTLDSSAVSSYIDLIASLVSFTVSQPYETLRLRIQSFRKEATANDETPTESLRRMFTTLDVQRGTKKYYLKQQAGSSTHGDGGVGAEAAPRTPFDDIVKYINKNLERETEWMPHFIERYAEAGGWHVREKKKLYALLPAQENRSERKKRPEKARTQDGNLEVILTEKERLILRNIHGIEEDIEEERVQTRREANLRKLEVRKQALDLEIQEMRNEVLSGKRKPKK
jgi:hypothetical protein